MKRLKQFFAGWNWFEKTFFVAVLILPAVFSVVFESSVVGWLSTTLYLLWAFLCARGKSYAHIIGIPAIFIYAYVSYTANYYGEVLITFFVMLPLIVISLFAWLGNKRADSRQGSYIVVSIPNKKEMAIAAASQFIMGVGYYFLLRAFNTDFLIVSTISIMTSVFATYLTMRRNQHTFVAYLVNDVVLIILWAYVVVGGQMEFIPILLMPIMLLANDIYGIFNWARLRKSQVERKGAQT